MGFKCGIVGLPNVGKSTLFNALTEAGIEAANYPFCTIEPNVGIVPLPDKRLDVLANIIKPQKVIPTTMEFVDIAGLVEGASEGEGLGNKFLAHIRETDAIAQVVRCFEDKDIAHVAGKIAPLDDIEIIHTELALADMATIDKAVLRAGKTARSGDKAAKAELAFYEKVKAYLDEGKPVRLLECSDDEMKLLKHLHLLTAKPTLYIANVHEDGFVNNAYLEDVVAHAKNEGAVVVPVCAKFEEDMIAMSAEEKTIFLQEIGLAESGLDRVIHAGYELLGLQTYFTAGEKEVRAWTVPIGATAPQAAGVIHTDFEKGFIRAEVVGYDDFIACNGEAGAKDAGKWRLEGKSYVMQDGDVVHFRFNA